MKRWVVRPDSGAALIYVLIFITVISVWLAGSLLTVQAGTSEILAAQRQNERSRAALAATVNLVSQVSKNATLGITGQQDNCGLGGSSYDFTDTATQITVNVQCEPMLDSGSIQPPDALILQGTSGEVGLGAGLAVVDGALQVATGIRNVSGQWAFNSSGTGGKGNGPKSGGTTGSATAKGIVRVPSGAVCDAVKDSNGNPAKCLSASVDLNLDPTLSTGQSTFVKNYWKTATGSTKGGIFPNGQLDGSVWNSTVQPATVPSCASPTDSANDWNNGFLTLTPGFYDQSDLDALNRLTDGTQTWGANPSGGACPAPTNLPTSGPGADKVTLRMAPGTYLFDFTWPNQTLGTQTTTLWKSVNKRFVLVSANATVGSTSYSCPATSSPYRTDADLFSNPDGVQWQFGGSSQVLAENLIVLCPTTFKGRPQISVVALSCDETAPSTAKPGDADCRVAKTATSGGERRGWVEPTAGFEPAVFSTDAPSCFASSGANFYQPPLLCAAAGVELAGQASNYGFQIEGAVFAPAGAVWIDSRPVMQGNGTVRVEQANSFLNGLIVKAFKAWVPNTVTGGMKASPALKLPTARQFNGDRWLKITVRDKSGRVISRSEVRVLDRFGQNPGYGLQVVSRN